MYPRNCTKRDLALFERRGDIYIYQAIRKMQRDVDHIEVISRSENDASSNEKYSYHMNVFH